MQVRLPHVVQLILAGLIIGGVWALKASAADVNAVLPTTITVGVLVKSLAGLLSGSVMGDK